MDYPVSAMMMEENNNIDHIEVLPDSA